MSDGSDGFMSSIYPYLRDFFIGAQGGIAGALILRKYNFKEISTRVVVGGFTAMYCNQAIGGLLGNFVSTIAGLFGSSFATGHDFAVYTSGLVGIAFGHFLIKFVTFLSERELK